MIKAGKQSADRSAFSFGKYPITGYTELRASSCSPKPLIHYVVWVKAHSRQTGESGQITWMSRFPYRATNTISTVSQADSFTCFNILSPGPTVKDFKTKGLRGVCIRSDQKPTLKKQNKTPKGFLFWESTTRPEDRDPSMAHGTLSPMLQSQKSQNLNVWPINKQHIFFLMQ